MVYRSRREPKHHYGRCNPKVGRLDPDDNPLSLLEGRKINLAGSRFDDSQANREAVDGASHVPPKTGSGGSGEGSEAVGLLLAYRHDYLFPVTTMHFLTNPVKAGTREWAKCACWVLVR